MINQFYTAYTQLREIYGIEIPKDLFETYGITAYREIGNRNIILKRQYLPVQDYIVYLPNDLTLIESVTISTPEALNTSNMHDFPAINNVFNELYIDSRKVNRSEYYTDGRLVKYFLLPGNKIKTTFKDGTVLLIYKAEQTCEDGLPFLTDKEVDAIAAFCAYTYLYRQGIATRDANTINFANDIKRTWSRLRANARAGEGFSQNDMDALGDVIMSWDVKHYGKTIKPIR